MLFVTGGTGPIHYEWFKEDELHIRIPVGTDSPAFILDPARARDAGTYYCEASDDLTTVSTDGSLLVVTGAMPVDTALGLWALLLTVFLVAAWEATSRKGPAGE